MTERTSDQIVFEISELLQELEDTLESETQTSLIGIPKRVVPYLNKIEPKISFVQDKTLKKNVGYALLSISFLSWILKRFNVYGPVRSNLTKMGIVHMNMVIEGLTHEYLNQKKVQKCKMYSKNIPKLAADGVDGNLCGRIDQLREFRENVHLHLVRDSEHEKYGPDNWKFSSKLVRDVCAEFKSKLEQEW